MTIFVSMYYEADQIYHVYNQGNNRKPIFFSRENYRYFLKKVAMYILPNADILSYSLMPNHFHFQLYMKAVGCEESNLLVPGYASQDDDSTRPKQAKFSKDLSILLRSYTRGINHQNAWTGSLFRSKTKCKQENNDEIIHNLNRNNIVAIDYPQTCFNYIHQNPVKAGLAQKAEDWPYSSAREYLNLPSFKLCNTELSHELGLRYER